MAVKEMSREERQDLQRIRRTLSKQGNSYGINLPKNMREDMGINAGDPIDLVYDPTSKRAYIEPAKNMQLPDGVRPEVLKALSNVLGMHGEALWKLRDR